MIEQKLDKLSIDVHTVWNDERSDMRLKKAIVRTLINEIIVDIDKEPGYALLIVHWNGGDHSQLRVQRKQLVQHRCTTDKDTITIIRELAEVLPDGDIAKTLNRLGRKTAYDKGWTQGRIMSIRKAYKISAYDPEQIVQKDYVTMIEAAKILEISPMSMHRLIKKRIIKSRQVIPGAPHLICRSDLSNRTIQIAAASVHNGKRVPLPQNPAQITLNL